MAIAKRKKRFYEVDMPLIKKQTQVQAFEISELEGRYIKYDLTRILRGKNIIFQQIVKVEEGKATTIPKKLTLMKYYLKRAVRKGTNYVEDSFKTECKDAEIKLKPFLVTRRKVSRAVRSALREKTKQELIAYVKKKNAEELFEEIMKNSLQKTLSLKLKKIYPLSLCEIKEIKVEKEIISSKKETTEDPKEEKTEEPIKERGTKAKKEKTEEKETPKKE